MPNLRMCGPYDRASPLPRFGAGYDTVVVVRHEIATHPTFGTSKIRQQLTCCRIQDWLSGAVFCERIQPSTRYNIISSTYLYLTS